PKRLLRQPGGFEGLRSFPIALKSAHLALVKVRHPSERNPGVQAAAPAASTYLPEGDCAIPKVPDLVNSRLDVLPCRVSVFPVLAEPVRPAIGSRLNRRSQVRNELEVFG